MQADLILKDAVVITMDPSRPRAGAVALSGSRILAAGTAGELEPLAGPGTRVIDCRGRTVVPGFNDAHCHIFSSLRKLLALDLGPDKVRSIADIKSVVREEAERTPPGAWISGTGFNEFYLAEKRFPDRRDLDEAAPHHPVVISHRSLHACVLNSRGLTAARISADTPDPPGGLIDRDLDTGEPTGILYEMLGLIREKVMPPVSDEDLLRGMALLNREFLSWGVTSVQEATVTNTPERWDIYRRMKENAVFRCRISLMLGMAALENFRAAGLGPSSGDDRLRLGPVKFVLSEATGRMQPSQTELNEQVAAAHRAGWQVAIHAIEPSTVEAAITSLENAQTRYPRPDSRHRIEHCSVCLPGHLERLARLQIVVVTQPSFIYYSGERYLATVPAEHQPWLYRLRSMLQKGIVAAAGSDSPIVPANPLDGIAAAVDRRARTGQPFLPGEAVTPLEALGMYTTGAAYSSFEENIKGSITPGKLADLVVLDGNPLQAAPDGIRAIRPLLTIIDGRIVWEAG